MPFATPYAAVSFGGLPYLFQIGCAGEADHDCPSERRRTMTHESSIRFSR
jgi:hypothetical protein